MEYELIIVGGGPAGLTAAIYAARASKQVLLIEKDVIGGTINFSPKVENYPGYDSISGSELADKFVDQTMKAGILLEFDEVLDVKKENNKFIVRCERETYEAKSVIIATGSKHRELGLENESKFVGHGVSYCAVCDGPFYTGMNVTLVGGGNSALQEAILLASYCNSVTIIQNLKSFTGEANLINEVIKNEKINVIYNSVVTRIDGTDKVNSLTIKDVTSNVETKLDTDGIFVAIGQEANNNPFKDIASLDDNGFIISDESTKLDVTGLFVAGDCRTKKVRQVVTATSDGATAALNAIRYIDSL